MIGWVAAHHGFPQRLRHFGLPDVVVAERHLMCRLFIFKRIAAQLRGRAHRECTALDRHHRELDSVDR